MLKHEQQIGVQRRQAEIIILFRTHCATMPAQVHGDDAVSILQCPGAQGPRARRASCAVQKDKNGGAFSFFHTPVKTSSVDRKTTCPALNFGACIEAFERCVWLGACHVQARLADVEKCSDFSALELKVAGAASGVPTLFQEIIETPAKQLSRP